MFYFILEGLLTQPSILDQLYWSTPFAMCLLLFLHNVISIVLSVSLYCMNSEYWSYSPVKVEYESILYELVAHPKRPDDFGFPTLLWTWLNVLLSSHSPALFAHLLDEASVWRCYLHISVIWLTLVVPFLKIFS